MKKIILLLWATFFLFSCWGSTNNAEVLNRLSNGYLSGWTNNVNQKVEMSFLWLPNQRYFDYYHLQKRLASLTGATINTGTGAIFTGTWSSLVVSTGSWTTGSWTTGSWTTGTGTTSVDTSAWNTFLANNTWVSWSFSWSSWLAIPGHDPKIQRWIQGLRYDFVASHGEAYNFRIYIYGSNGLAGNGNTWWLVSPTVLKIDTVKPLFATLSYSTTRYRNTDLNITHLWFDELSGFQKIELLESSNGVDFIVRNTITDPSIISTIIPASSMDGQSRYYAIRMYDKAWNTKDSGTGTLVYFDVTSPNSTISYTLANGSPYIPWTWSNQDITVRITCDDSSNNGGWCDMRNIPNWNISGNTYSRTFSSDNNSINGNITLYDKAGNITIVNYGELKIDKTAPTLSDIWDTRPWNNAKLLATTNQNISLIVSENGGAPIVDIQAYFEDKNTSNSYKSTAYTSSTWTLDKVYNISNVDRDRGVDGSREYSLKITKICDAAGNCIQQWNNSGNGAWIKNFSYFVYANTHSIISSWDVSWLSNINNVADDTVKNVTIHLEDQYGNIIIPASGIHRQIGFNIILDNNLRFNQYNNTTDSALYIENQQVVLGNSVVMNLNNRNSIDGDYTIPFYTYAPISAGNTKLVNITFNTNDNLAWNIPGQSISGSVLSSHIVAKPLYTTSFSWDLVSPWFREWATQITQVSVRKDPASSSIVQNSALRLEFGSGSFIFGAWASNPVYSLQESGVPISEWYQPSWRNLTKIGWLITKNMSTYMTQDTIVTTWVQSYLASIISYSLSINGVNKDIVYVGDTIGDGTITWGNTYQTAIKVLGNVSSQNTQELVANQFSNDVRVLWNITKTALKENIQKNVYSVIKNISSTNNISNKIVNIGGNIWNNTSGGENLLAGKVLYFKNPSGWIVEIKADTIVWVKTVVVENGSIYISWNIINNSNKDILWIIALKGNNPQSWNIYIDPSVTDIHAVMYADKSLISYNGSEIDGNTLNSMDILRHQLYIYGSIFSENTIGGSRKNPVECPFYVQESNCTLAQEAQKYDLNYLRRYFLYDSNGDGILDASSWNSSNARWQTGFDNFPVIVDYNPLVQQTPPPFFD